MEWRFLNETFDLSARKFHATAKTPYLWMPENKTFVGYEDAESIRHKVRKKTCHLLESNQRPSLYESDALPLSQ